jgi:hypothetical protein
MNFDGQYFAVFSNIKRIISLIVTDIATDI